jgi:hypothetical protein
MVNMCIMDQEHLFCREGAAVANRAKSFVAKMDEAGTPFIKILPTNHYGKNVIDKWVKQIRELTGAPPH